MQNIIIFTLSLLFFLANNRSSAQIFNIAAPNITIQQADSALRANAPLSDTSEGGWIDICKYYHTFWCEKVFNNDSSNHTMFSNYYNNWRKATTERITSSSGTSFGSGFQGNWKNIGPDFLQGDQKIGKIDALWGDDDTMLAGATGGLFISLDSGFNWKCITDNTMIAGGICGINSIAVNPLNHNTIFCGTGMYDERASVETNTFWNNHTFSAGILESFDRGNTWTQEFIPTGGSSYYDSLIPI